MSRFSRDREKAVANALEALPAELQYLAKNDDVLYALQGMFVEGWSTAVNVLENELSEVRDDESIISSAITRAERTAVREA